MFKVRHFVNSWQSSLGDSATPEAIVEALSVTKPKSKDIIDEIMKNCV